MVNPNDIIVQCPACGNEMRRNETRRKPTWDCGTCTFSFVGEYRNLPRLTRRTRRSKAQGETAQAAA